MKAIFVGRSEWTDLRIERARHFGIDVRVVDPGQDFSLIADQPAKTAVFVAAGADDLLPISEAAVRALSHVFLDSDPMPPLADARLLIARAKEAGVQMSGTRPMWFDERIQALMAKGPARVLSVSASLNSLNRSWRRSLRVATDLTGALCGTFSTHRVDAEVYRRDFGVPAMALLSIRFLNGSFAHIRIGPEDSSGEVCRVFAATDVGLESLEVRPGAGLVKQETDAFLGSLLNASSPPVELRSVLDASTLVEKVLRRLRQ